MMSLCLMMIMKILVHQRIDITDVKGMILETSKYDTVIFMLIMLIIIVRILMKTSKGWDHNHLYHKLRHISRRQIHKVFPRIWGSSSSSSSSSLLSWSSYCRCHLFLHHWCHKITFQDHWCHMDGRCKQSPYCLPEPKWSPLSLSQACDHDNMITLLKIILFAGAMIIFVNFTRLWSWSW